MQQIHKTQLNTIEIETNTKHAQSLSSVALRGACTSKFGIVYRLTSFQTMTTRTQWMAVRAQKDLVIKLKHQKTRKVNVRWEGSFQVHHFL